MRFIYECPACGEMWSHVEHAGLLVRATPSKVCPHGHKVTKALRQQRRRRQVILRAEAAGMTEAEYRADRRKQAAWDRSPLNPWSTT